MCCACLPQGGACYEEVHQLWQHVTKAEQAASEATAALQTHKDAATQAVLELKVCRSLYLLFTSLSAVVWLACQD